MLSSPRGHYLLAGARALLLDDLLPELSSEQKRKARIIAEAMASAERELHDFGEAASRELRLLFELYGEAPPPLLAPSEVEECLRSMNARLVRDIRAGALDRHQAGRLRRVLLHQVISRLRIASPTYLHASGYG